jgi:hypothetical protein
MSSTLSPFVRRRSTVCSMSSVLTGGPAAVVALAGRGVESFEGGFADVLALGLGHCREEPEQQASRTAGVVRPLEGSGEHFQDQAVGGEVIGQGWRSTSSASDASAV